MKTFYCSIAVFVFSASCCFAQLNGSYTVGSGGDYTTIEAAVSAAENLGINGPVTFNILTGSYTEQVTIDPVPGSSPVNTLTIRSQTGNPADVNLIYDDVSTLHLFLINGADNIIIRDLSFIRTAKIPLGGLNTARIKINSNTDNLKIINNVFFMPDTLLHASLDIGNFDFVFNVTNLLIEGNTFSREYNNFWLISDLSSNVKIAGNNFLGLISLGWPIFIEGIESAIIEKNICQHFGSTFINLNGVKTIIISKNKITGRGLGIKIEGGGNPVTSSIISNNFISYEAGAGRGIFMEGQNIFLIYNTIVTLNSPVYIFYGSSITVLNNLFLTNRWYIEYNASFSLCDYNNYYNYGDSVIVYAGVPYTSIPDLYAGTGLDQHSTEVPVQFVSPTDLHLAGTSIGDEQLIGIPTLLVSDDIDGQTRNPNYPYKGADEVVDFPLPVELASFTAAADNNTVNLKWSTNSELNNSGFDVERKFSNSSEWIITGSVNGHGTSNSLNNYEFTDRNLLPGIYNYRLKQIDLNGNFEYHILSNEVLIGVPDEFKLSQNYPNPFNPVTKITFDIPQSAFSTGGDVLIDLKIYDILGNEIKTLVNEKKSPGRYEVIFDASGLSSGVYFYRLSADGRQITGKSMLLLK